jgi:hypothetical protein
MDQRGQMPPIMRAFVTFISIAFVATLGLTIARQDQLIDDRTRLICFFLSIGIAGLTAWAVYRKPKPV